MQTIVDDLAQNLLNQSKRRAEDGQSRILVGLCGIPGSGKSQLARHVINRINAINDDHQNIAIVVGMDGWHLTREQLSKMPDPQLAKDRRGAAWTFDDKAFAAFVENLRSSSSSSTILAPSFDHAKKDPIQDDIEILPFHQIIVIEGLYANLNKGEWWSKASSLYDERWLIECDERVARSRLIKRHVETGVAQSEAEAEWRADNNDLPNGRFLLANITEPYKRIRSQDDEEWKGSG